MDKQGEWLLAYVEKCMRRGMSRVVGAFEHVPTGLCFDAGSARCQVRVEAAEPAMVRVMALAVCDVRPSAALLREINELNANSRITSAWWHDGDVIVECSLFAQSVDVETLQEGCLSVIRVANDIGVGMAAMYDGCTPLSPFVDDAEDAA